MEVVTRFPPSPTGRLHVGGARTALYNWLLARRAGGRFLVRIEDTDRERSRPEFVEDILDSLAWLGLEPDGPIVHQSARVEAHRAAAERLLEAGAAYPCFCAPADLEAKRAAAEAAGSAWRYDGTCRGLPSSERAARRAAGRPHVVRLKVEPGETVFRDAVRGEVRVGHDQLDDLVVLKADGTPTYHLAVVVDDADAGVTHVVRGEDHVSNTPKQILLQRSLGLPTPVYAHLPLLHAPDGKKLSKRHADQVAFFVRDYRDRGYLPEGLLNYLVLLGWSPGGDREVMTREEMVSLFALERVVKKAAVFDAEKCAWMNGEHLRALPPAAVRARLADRLAAFDLSAARLAAWGVPLARDEWLDRIVALVQPRARTLVEAIDRARFFLEEKVVYDPAAFAKHGSDARFGEVLAAVRTAVAETPWTPEAIEAAVRGAADRLGLKPSQVMPSVRVAVTGRAASPGLFDTLYLLGRARTLARLTEAVA